MELLKFTISGEYPYISVSEGLHCFHMEELYGRYPWFPAVKNLPLPSHAVFWRFDSDMSYYLKGFPDAGSLFLSHRGRFQYR